MEGKKIITKLFFIECFSKHEWVTIVTSFILMDKYVIGVEPRWGGLLNFGWALIFNSLSVEILNTWNNEPFNHIKQIQP